MEFWQRVELNYKVTGYRNPIGSQHTHTGIEIAIEIGYLDLYPVYPKAEPLFYYFILL